MFETQAARCNAWYYAGTEGVTYLNNFMPDDLLNKWMEYNDNNLYKQNGRSLLFIYMMQILSSNLEKAIKSFHYTFEEAMCGFDKKG